MAGLVAVCTTRKGGKKHGSISDGTFPVAKNGFLRRQLKPSQMRDLATALSPSVIKNARIGSKCISISDGCFYRRQKICFETAYSCCRK
ncbi:hypothetical protein HYC85_027974 [Camellia sinensis]|uniref:Uncharacterized protein n=1 Tax=Camellia sinensis TaxID=4442 RepID=A0A7J7FTT2_CAMSI|nr:hypothetical protein HYC85_027974 [Camellia sinensis]